MAWSTSCRLLGTSRGLASTRHIKCSNAPCPVGPAACIVHRRLAVKASAAASSGAGKDGKDVDSLLAKYAAPNNADNKPTKAAPTARPAPAPAQVVVTPSALLSISFGLGTLLAVNLGIYMLAVYGGKGAAVANMVLGASGGPWWKYISSAFVHASWSHLLRDLVTVWLAGSLLRKELSSAGIWLTYCLCGLGANLSAMWWMPLKAKAAGGLLGLGSTGGAFGLGLVVLLLAFRLSPGYALAGTLFWELLLAPMLSSPVPGAAAAVSRPGLPDLMGLVFAHDPLSIKVATAQQWMVGTMVDPGLAWAWGAGIAALAIVLLARVPLPGDE